MKKSIMILLLSLVVLMLIGCAKQDQTANFIPTPIPSQEDVDEDASETGDNGDETGSETGDNGSETETEDGNDPDDKDEPIYIGKTTPMYVKVNQYDGILNIRKTPSKDGEIVGFLVHTEKIQVISIENGWASFLYKDEICYASADFLVDKKPAYIDPPSPTPSPTPSPASNTEAPEI